MLLAPGGFEQSQRLLGLQQAADERAKAQRLSEDEYKITDQIEKDRATRTGQIVDFTSESRNKRCSNTAGSNW